MVHLPNLDVMMPNISRPIDQYDLGGVKYGTLDVVTLPIKVGDGIVLKTSNPEELDDIVDRLVTSGINLVVILSSSMCLYLVHRKS